MVQPHNKVSDWSEIEKLRQNQKLLTVYFEHNQIAKVMVGYY